MTDRSGEMIEMLMKR